VQIIGVRGNFDSDHPRMDALCLALRCNWIKHVGHRSLQFEIDT